MPWRIVIFCFTFFLLGGNGFSGSGKFPTPERTWTVNGRSVLGRVVKFDSKRGILQMSEIVSSGKKRVRPILLESLAQVDQEYFQQFFRGEVEGKVIGVIDGDTIEILTSARKRVRVRLHGIDAPESNQEFSSKSKERLSALSFGKQVVVRLEDEDSFGRLIGFVFDEYGTNINLEMVRSGMAWHYIKYLPDDDAFAKAQSEAKTKKSGLWAGYRPMSPWDFRSRKNLKVAPGMAETQTKVVGGKLKPNPKKFWLNLNSGERHNESCRWFGETKNGKYCGKSEGKACGKCGG